MRNYRVIIVEDERFVRIGIITGIPWDKYNMEVVGNAADGQSAFRLYEESLPDVIITDIRMPRMDGIELIRKIRAIDNSVKIIILTCLEEFMLVRAAVNLNVSGYILKLTTQDAEIDAILRRVRSELDQRYMFGNSTERSPESTGSTSNYSPHATADIIEQIDAASTRRGKKPAVIGIISLDPCQKSQIDERLFGSAVSTLISEAVQSKGESLVLCNTLRQYVFALWTEVAAHDTASVRSSLRRSMERLRKAILTYLNSTVSLGIDDTTKTEDHVQERCRLAEEALARAYFIGRPVCYASEEFDLNEEFKRAFALLLNAVDVFNDCDLTIRKRYSIKITSLLETHVSTVEKARDILYQYVKWLTVLLFDTVAIDLDKSLEFVETIKSMAALDDAVAAIRRYVSELTDLKKTMKPSSNQVKLALEYIEANYRNDITLESVAAEVSLSPGYLSSLIRSELRMSYVDYLSNVRIHKAKHLLSTMHKTGDVARLVGFHDAAYFCRVFKNQTGMTPLQYRKEWSRPGNEE